jgi:hypothetical protein
MQWMKYRFSMNKRKWSTGILRLYTGGFVETMLANVAGASLARCQFIV